MKVTAYKTECCNTLKDISEVHGVIINKDLFDIYKSYVTVLPEKSNVHYCTSCYTDRVIESSANIYSRKHNEQKYQEKLKELAYVFKKSLFTSNGLLPSDLAP